MKTVYLDNCATAPLHPDVLKAMLPFLRHSFGNPSSAHALGMKAR
jgi:cysteine desulfurase